QVIRAVKAGDWQQAGDRVTAAGIELEPGEYELRMTAGGGSGSAPPGEAGAGGLGTPGAPGQGGGGGARELGTGVRRGPPAAGLGTRPAGTRAWLYRTGSGWSSGRTARWPTRSARTPGS